MRATWAETKRTKLFLLRHLTPSHDCDCKSSEYDSLARRWVILTAHDHKLNLSPNKHYHTKLSKFRPEIV